jgi:hypothetical protein
VVPRYFFHVYDGDEMVVQDSHGLDFASKLSLKENLARIVGAVIDEEALDYMVTGSKVLRVVDANDRVVIIVPLH